MTRIEKGMFFVDSDSPELGAVELAIRRAEQAGATITFVAVVEPGRSFLRRALGPSSTELENLLAEEAAERLETIVAPHRGRDVEIETRVLRGEPSTAVTEEIISGGYDLLIKEIEPGGRLRKLGSTDLRLLRACPCPTVIVRAEAHEGRHTVVAALDVPSPDGGSDFDELNGEILDTALDLMIFPDSELRVIHAWTLYGESILSSPRVNMSRSELKGLREQEHDGRRMLVEEFLTKYAAGLSEDERKTFAPVLEMIKGEPQTVIPRYLKKVGAEALVIGTRSRQRLDGFLIGNTAERVLRDAHCSVVAVKPPGYVSPLAKD